MADLISPDPIADIRALLLADNAVTTLVDERIFHSELPATESATMPRKAIVIAAAGGSGRRKTMHLRRLRVDTICHGETLYESQKVHDAVRNVLENLDRTSGSVKTIETNVEGQNGRDPEKQWPTCFATYSVLATIAV